MFTFMMYLNGGVAGGATEFNLRSRGSIQNDDPIIRVQPEPGKALVFVHRILHRGARWRMDGRYGAAHGCYVPVGGVGVAASDFPTPGRHVVPGFDSLGYLSHN